MADIATHGRSLPEIVRKSAQANLLLDLPETFTHGSLFYR